ncbi:MAG TPA: phosphoadenosine phosphosulfate reductase family protein, partial [Methanocorpusculum sp.]|nr:phosphoadenosine phosphosulfate reductase family protein [Methanocorpusculum sp.]
NHDETDGVVIIKYKSKYGTGQLNNGFVRLKKLITISSPTLNIPNPDWTDVITRNAFHIKNIERTAIREIKQNLKLAPTANCSFSGGKDSTATWHIAQKAGVTNAFFVDTGLEFPETVAFVKKHNVHIIRNSGHFWKTVEKFGPPTKDHRWCCELLKLNPINSYLSKIGKCVTVQGNRWYESRTRADLGAVSVNSNNIQINVSPIRSWRALDVYLYLWFREIPYNPLYDRGYERIGCYLCPAMLESEFLTLRQTHPDLAESWYNCLIKWAESQKLPIEYIQWGLWRWNELPPKMQDLIKNSNIMLPKRMDTRKSLSSVKKSNTKKRLFKRNSF